MSLTTTNTPTDYAQFSFINSIGNGQRTSDFNADLIAPDAKRYFEWMGLSGKLLSTKYITICFVLNIDFSVRTTVLYVESEKIENSNESVKKIPTKTVWVWN